MSAGSKLRKELKELSLAMLYFAAWIGLLVMLKALILAEYQIEFRQWSAILVGALVLGKVVLILEHVPLGGWIERQPAIVDVLARTLLYSFGVFVVLLIERGFEGRHDAGGFIPAVRAVFQDPDMPHVWANTICLSAALFGYNVISVFRRYLGEGGIARVLLSPLPAPGTGDPTS
jgi:hypothetical protein